jgi:hypothetical protein
MAENAHKDFKWKDSPAWAPFLQKALANSVRTPPAGVPGNVNTPSDILPPPNPDDPSFNLPTFGTADNIKEILDSTAHKEELKTVNPLQVEILLDQAAELFDRASRTRERITTLRVSAFQNTIELLEFLALDPIHEKEIQAGRYSAPVEEKRSQANASANQVKALSDELKVINNFMAWFDPAKQDTLVLNSKKVTVGSTTPGGTGGGALDALEPDWNKSVRTQALLAWCSVIHETDVKQRVTSFVSQQANLTSAVAAAQERANGDERMAKYMEDTLDYQLERVNVARQLFQYKLTQSQRVGGALAYRDQIGPLIISARNDAAHALARLEKASEGMHQLFNYSAGAVGPAPDFDEYMQRARDTINWYRSFSRRDETLTIPISLKRVSGDKWQDDLRALQWGFSISDEERDTSLPSVMLRDRRYARIRGITAYFDGAFEDNETFQIKVQPPSDSSVRWATGSLQKLPAQKDIPSVWLGRVASRNSTRQPEVVGAVTLLNASPIGRWQVSVAPRSAEGGLPNDVFQHLKDIVIEIGLVAQSKTAGA